LLSCRYCPGYTGPEWAELPALEFKKSQPVCRRFDQNPAIMHLFLGRNDETGDSGLLEVAHSRNQLISASPTPGRLTQPECYQNVTESHRNLTESTTPELTVSDTYALGGIKTEKPYIYC